MPCASQVAESKGPELDGLFHQTVEEKPARAGGAPVEPEGKLIKVIGQMLTFHPTLMRPNEPAFQQRRHSMDPGKESVGLLAAAANDPLQVNAASRFQAQIRRQAVGDHRGSWSDALFDEDAYGL
jgi:hypothetical protein